MRNIAILSLSLILLGAGCFGSGSSSGGSDGGVFKTTTSGEEWGQAVIVPTAQGIGTLATSNILNMEMDPQDNSYLYIGTRSNGMLFSEDSGLSWRQPEHGDLREGLIFNVEVDPTDVCTVYVAKGSRLYATSDCMRTFDSEVYVDNRGVSVVQIAVDWYDNNNVWIGLGNGDVLKSTDAGGTWRTVLKTGEEISEILINNQDSRSVLVSTFESGIQKTTDSGESWNRVEGNLEDLKAADEIFSLIQTSDSSTLLIASSYGLLRSEDFGSTWEPLELVTSPGQITIRAVGMDQENPDTIYYASNATFYRSLDGGKTWDTERFPTTRVPRVMLVDPVDPTVLYVGVATASE